MAEFLKWRKSLGYTQEEAGKKLGVSRATIQNWEKGVTRIPRAAELACLQVARRWKQRSEFGPVALVYPTVRFGKTFKTLIALLFCIANSTPITRLRCSRRAG